MYLKTLGVDTTTSMTCFYAHNELVFLHIPKALQLTFEMLICIFDHTGLQTNTMKLEIAVFLTGRIREYLNKDTYFARMDGLYSSNRKE